MCLPCFNVILQSPYSTFLLNPIAPRSQAFEKEEEEEENMK